VHLSLTPDPTANGAAPKSLPVAPLLADARALGNLLSLGLRTIRQMDSAGKLPRPLKLNTRVLWCVQEIRDWLEAGAPCRAEWEALKKAKHK